MIAPKLLAVRRLDVLARQRMDVAESLPHELHSEQDVVNVRVGDETLRSDGRLNWRALGKDKR